MKRMLSTFARKNMDVPFQGSGHRIKTHQALVLPVSPSLPGNGLDVWKNKPQKKHSKLDSNPILDSLHW